MTVYERLSWEPAFALAGGHSAPVNAVCFSADGACRAICPALLLQGVRAVAT